jgi:L,D-peptidoglycan transpeptidase YkuD (ErfK/YbiS/YcfS/YnhG family)
VQASQASGFCLDDTGGRSANGIPIQIWSCQGNANQSWTYVPSESGVVGDYQLENANGSCLDDPGDSAVNGTRVQLWSCLGDASQTWTRVSAGSYTEYVNANGLCLDNTGNALTDGNRVQVWACNGDTAQQWLAPQGQLITVTASYGSTYATLTAYDLNGSGWALKFGPWTARVGYNGIAAPGTKREGDGKTPSGTYAFGFFFGVLPDPGVSFPYRNVYSYDYWDDDPQSPLYNEWVDTRTQNAGRNPEPMDNVPAYNYGAVIAYNTARTPGLGSAIFLHVDTGGSTAGCVSLPQSELVTILTWLNSADDPVIQITGV